MGDAGLYRAMDAEPPLDYLLDGPAGGAEPAASEPAPGRDELQSIVTRSRRRTARVAAVGMAATLAVGAAAGWLAGLAARGSTRTTTIAAGSPSVPTAGAVAPSLGFAGSGGGFTSASGTATILTKLFARTTADGVTIRLYQLPTFANSPAGVGGCPIPFPSVEAEVSTANIAASAVGFVSPSATAPFKSVTPTILGGAEGAPVWVVTTDTSASVAAVRATFPDGKTDQMTAVKGWASLVHVAPLSFETTTTGSVQALDARGDVVGTTSFTTSGYSDGSQSAVEVAPGAMAPGDATATASATTVPEPPPITTSPGPTGTPPTTVESCVPPSGIGGGTVSSGSSGSESSSASGSASSSATR